VHIDDVNRMVKSFKRMKQFFKDMPSMKKQWQKEAGNKENFLWR
jgi:signal recognition particle GTPase